MVERKTVINLLEAYAVAVKHYLRGEDGIYYQCVVFPTRCTQSRNLTLISRDLYYLVKFLPAYALPKGIPSQADLDQPGHHDSPPSSPVRDQQPTDGSIGGASSFLYQRRHSSAPHLPAPVTSAQQAPRLSNVTYVATHEPQAGEASPEYAEKVILPRADESYLMPARMPPKYHIFDLFPFSLVVRFLTKRGASLKGRKAARMRAKMRDRGVSHNLPLEISLYLVSWL
jgi:hypothetical protein